MSFNENPWVKELLSWHGHDQGGIRIPFNPDGGNPLRDDKGKPEVIVTRLIEKLRQLARKLARGDDSPRWIFLVGGPGNGKSEAVQDFINTLDAEIGCNGLLIDYLSHLFVPRPLLPWSIEVRGEDAKLHQPSFNKNIGRLVMVQDASASEQPDKDAAVRLVDYILDLATSPGPMPVFICCINRGLLARTLKVAHEIAVENEVVEIIESLIQATALGRHALSQNRPRCWPLDLPPGNTLAGMIACWPLDMESLFLSINGEESDFSPVNQAILQAVKIDKWEIFGRCMDCEAANLCPFRQNAAWLREEKVRQNLLRILRRGELATGQRWNFRNIFSLVAELLIGEWGDFKGVDIPCKWVHTMVAQQQEQHPIAIKASFELLSRLYPNAMFPTFVSEGLPEEAYDTANQCGFEKTLAINDLVSVREPLLSTHIRTLLRDTISPRLDPVILSPHDDHPLEIIEDAYSQSVVMGNSNWPKEAPMSAIEETFLNFSRDAEEEWDPLGRESARVLKALKFLRVFCSSIAKRSIGVRLGFHANERYLKGYELTIRNEDLLNNLTDALRSLLEDNGFHFNAIGSFGQPQSDVDWLISLRGDSVSIEPITPAPPICEDLPAHDLPFIQISGHSIPLTFDLYMALRLRKEGCMSSSLPTSVRAAIDRIRHLYAGSLCRDEDKFVHGSAKYVLKGLGKIVISRRGDIPRFRGGGI